LIVINCANYKPLGKFPRNLSPTLSTPSLPTHLHNGQVDAGLGAEELVENLIDGNLELEEKIGQSLIW